MNPPEPGKRSNPLRRRALLHLGMRVAAVGAMTAGVPFLWAAKRAHARDPVRVASLPAVGTAAPPLDIQPPQPSEVARGNPGAGTPPEPPRMATGQDLPAGTGLAESPADTMSGSSAPRSGPQPQSVQPLPTRSTSERAISRVATARPIVALTVDDGWAKRNEIMRLLVDRGVPAVFFLTARAVSGDDAFLQAAVAAGFEIGNHTTTHRNLSALRPAEIEVELDGMVQTYRRAMPSGPPMRFFRAPYGALSGSVLDASEGRQYRTIQWDVSTKDWTDLDTDGITRSVVVAARPGSVILSHFNARCLAALPQIIAGVRANGLEFVALDALLAAATPAVAAPVR